MGFGSRRITFPDEVTSIGSDGHEWSGGRRAPAVGSHSGGRRYGLIDLALPATLVGAVWLSAGFASAGDAASKVGTWVYNPHESINMPVPDEAQIVEIRRNDTVLDYTWTGVTKDGKTSTFSHSMAPDGVARPLPGSDGLRGSMTRTPSGVIEAKLFFPDGSSEEKFCLLSAPTRQTCFAAYVDRAGKASLVKQIFEKR